MPKKKKRGKKESPLTKGSLEEKLGFYPDGSSRLTRAASSGSIPSVSLWVRKGHNVNAHDQRGYTALLVAAQLCYIPLINYLVDEAEADIQTTHATGEWGLITAVLQAKKTTAQQKKETINLLIKKGIKPKGSEIALVLLEGQFENAERFFVSGGTTAINSRDGVGATPLLNVVNMQAYAKQPAENIVAWLLEHKADPGIPNNSGITPLMLAKHRNLDSIIKRLEASQAEPRFTDLIVSVQSGDVGKVKYCLSKGKLDVNQQSGELRATLLMLAADHQQEEMVKYLVFEAKADVSLIAKDGSTALLRSASKRSRKIVLSLLLKQAEINHRNAKGFTALIIAAQESYTLGILETLLSFRKTENPLQVNQKGPNGITALGHAVFCRNLPAVKLLLSHPEIDVSESNDEGATPVIVAAYLGELEMLKLLVANKASLDAQDAFGRTPLLVAALSGHLAIVKEILFKQLKHINHQDSSGMTPVAHAAENGRREIVTCLLGNGADIHLLDNVMGWSPLMFAAVKGHVDTVKILLQFSADIQQKDNMGLNAKDLATLYRQNAILAVLQQHELKQQLELICKDYVPDELVDYLHSHQTTLSFSKTEVTIQQQRNHGLPIHNLSMSQEKLIQLCKRCCEGERPVAEIYVQFIQQELAEIAKATPAYHQQQLEVKRRALAQLKQDIGKAWGKFGEIRDALFTKLDESSRNLKSPQFQPSKEGKAKTHQQSNTKKRTVAAQLIEAFGEEYSAFISDSKEVGSPRIEIYSAVIQQGHILLADLSTSIYQLKALDQALIEQLNFEKNCIQSVAKRSETLALVNEPPVKKEKKGNKNRRVKNPRKMTVAPSQPQLGITLPVKQKNLQRKRPVGAKAALAAQFKEVKTGAVSPAGFFSMPQPQRCTIDQSLNLSAALQAYTQLDLVRSILHQAAQFNREYPDTLLKNALMGAYAKMMESFKRIHNGLNPFTPEEARQFRNVCYHAAELFAETSDAKQKSTPIMSQLIDMGFQLLQYANAQPKKTSSSIVATKITSSLYQHIQAYSIQQTPSLPFCRQQLAQGKQELESFKKFSSDNHLVKTAIEFTAAELGAYASKLKKHYPDEFTTEFQSAYGRFIPVGAHLRHPKMSSTVSNSSIAKRG